MIFTCNLIHHEQIYENHSKKIDNAEYSISDGSGVSFLIMMLHILGYHSVDRKGTSFCNL